MNYNLSKLENKYEVKLDDTQKEVLSSLIDFVESDSQTICLNAQAGTGKTILASILYDILDENDISCTFVAPTNKAKNVIASKGDSNRCSTTIHSLLNLRPNLEIMDFDASQLSFSFVKSKGRVDTYEILLIDECSMINNDLYDTLCSKFKTTKIIFLGDDRQLSPVKQTEISKTFTGTVLSLTKIYRQQESILYNILQYLRHTPLYKFKELHDDSCNITICNNICDMIVQYSYLFKIGEDFKDFKLVKLITYTNRRLDALNQLIREQLYSGNSEYNIREILTGYDTCSCYNSELKNSKDYIVTRTRKCIITRSNIELLAYEISLEDESSNIEKYTILSKYNTQSDFDLLAKNLETLRQKAVQSKQSKDWALFYNLNNSFLTPIDLIYDNRVIKNKSIDYGYCISAHKSQSSSYSVVLIDMENIWRCANKEELRQLQYVACSRTTSDLIIYQKNDKNF